MVFSETVTIRPEWVNLKDKQVKDNNEHCEKENEATDLLLAWNPICLGLVEGLLGKIQLHTDLPLGLILIRQKALVGKLPGNHEVYKITKIVVIPLSDDEPQDLELELCKKHHFGINKPEKITQSPDESKFLLKTLSQIKSNVAVPIKKKVKENKEKERLERRLLEELFKMFMDSDSFYYSLTYDLTNTVQRQNDREKTDKPLWQRVDDRFFWNKHMVQDLINLNDVQADSWILPVIQGFVQAEEMVVNYSDSSDEEKSSPETSPQEPPCVDDIYPRFLVALISRRSRHRAGMRYKRRGVDKNGNVANYVETEQLIHVHNHTLSFVQTRGSVPVFWSQVGYRYNPRPRLETGEMETIPFFAAHFEEQLKIYKKQVIINLVDQSGREKLIGDAYLKQVLLYNNPNLTYVSFDFHEHCRGMKFENVQTLADAIGDLITDMKWGWHSKPHEDIISIRTKNSEGQVLGSMGLAQGKNFLLNKFSSLNQKVKQTKSNVNMGSFKPLGKLGSFSKPEMKVNFLKPNLKVNLWKSDSSLETSDSTVAGALKDRSESDLEISSDSDSFHSNEFLPNEDEDRQLAGSLENFDYVLPSCGIVAAAPRLGSRTQSITSTDISGIPAPPSMICVTDCDRKPENQPENNGKSYEHPTPSEEAALIDFGTPIDAYCQQFVQDAQSKDPSMEELGFNQPLPASGHSSSNPPRDVEGHPEQRDQQLSRPSQLDVATSLEANLLSVQPATSAASSSSQKSLGSQLQASTGPSPAEGNGSRVASPFAKIRSSMVQVASMTQAGLTQGINFAVAKVQKSPEPESINEAQQSDFKAMFTQCQTRIIQI
ncbi:Phosphatidylinositide phosphatase SAC2 [Acipenser ruthenus]|uniref:Phosphatidylinositide phosphatase SAC2 n=1 Tax=Acipenser ruthenus TaxID=7906 RepID=A0A444UM09_ACIRT|nr:Phosphatidylinositide phosphatase SAC2 [Acipenser ruthenus]